MERPLKIDLSLLPERERQLFREWERSMLDKGETPAQFLADSIKTGEAKPVTGWLYWRIALQSLWRRWRNRGRGRTL